MCLAAIGVVTEVWDEGGLPMASVAVDGQDQAVCMAYVPEARIGESVLVHLGFAVQRLDADQASDAQSLRQAPAGERPPAV